MTADTPKMDDKSEHNRRLIEAAAAHRIIGRGGPYTTGSGHYEWDARTIARAYVASAAREAKLQREFSKLQSSVGLIVANPPKHCGEHSEGWLDCGRSVIKAFNEYRAAFMAGGSDGK